MATYKSDLCSASPKQIRAELGYNTVIAEYTHTSGAALQKNDVIQMVPVPQYATVVECQLYVTPGFEQGSSGGYVVGDGSSLSRFINRADTASSMHSGGVCSSLQANKTRKMTWTYTSGADTIDIVLVSGKTAKASTSKYLRLRVSYITNKESATAYSTFGG
jgi:hypothetical protein